MEILGRHREMAGEEYHYGAGKYALSKGGLDRLNRSVLHYNEQKVERSEPTPAMAVGTAFHANTLEPDRFCDQVAVAPSVDRRTKKGKQDLEDFALSANGKAVISEQDMERVRDMTAACLAHDSARALLRNGAAENSFFWQIGDTLCKCRPDYLREDAHVIVDLKSTTDASFKAFQRSCVNYRYYVQAAWYIDGVNDVLGAGTVDSFVIIAVESAPPYGVAVYAFDEIAVDVGRRQAAADMQKLLDYNAQPEAERYAGYDRSIQEMYLPSWVE